MRRVIDNLDSADKGNLAEAWHQAIYGQPNALTHVEIKTHDAASQGITLTAEQRRFVDRVEGDTIVEVKTISGTLASGGKDSRSEIDQFKDNIELAENGYKMPKERGGEQQINNVRYVFTLPEGVQANAKFMLRELRDNRENLSFEIFNEIGERKIITYENRKELQIKALTNWLYPSN